MDMSEQLVTSHLDYHERESERCGNTTALIAKTIGIGGAAFFADEILASREVYADVLCNPWDPGAVAHSEQTGVDESGNPIYRYWYTCPDAPATTQPPVTTQKPTPTTTKPPVTTSAPSVTQPKPTNPPVVTTSVPVTTLAEATTTVTATTTTEAKATTTIEKTTTTKDTAAEGSSTASSTTTTLAEAVVTVPEKGKGFMDQYGTEAGVGFGALATIGAIVFILRRRTKNNQSLAA